MLLSIIIPVYNSEKYILRCLNSIFLSVGLNEDEYEVICVNDGSTDSSLDILKGIKNCHENLMIINEKNQGAFLSRQKGIENASGEWIGFVDSDDEIINGMYDKMLKKAKCYSDIDLVVCAFEKVDSKTEKTIAVQMDDYGDLVIDFVDDSEELGMMAAVNPAYWNKIYKKELVDKCIKLDYSPKIMEDYIFWGSIIPFARKAAFIKEPLYRYYDNCGSASKTVGETELAEARKALYDLNSFLCQNKAYICSIYKMGLIEASAVLHLGVAFSINYNNYKKNETVTLVWNKTIGYLEEIFVTWKNNCFLKLPYVSRHMQLFKMYVACSLYKMRIWPVVLKVYFWVCKMSGQDMKW